MDILDTRARTGDRPDSRALIDALRRSGTTHGPTAARLLDLLLRTARFEIGRRRTGGLALNDAEADELARQATDSALAVIGAHLRDQPRTEAFVVWARKFAIAEVAAKVAQHVWHIASGPAGQDGQDGWEQLLPDVMGLPPGGRAAWAGSLAVIRRAADENLSQLQRAVFVAATVRGASIDVVAVASSSSRSAIYKAQFEARRILRTCLEADGFGLQLAPGRRPQDWLGGLDHLLGVTPGDAGCDVAFQKLDVYVETERRGVNPGDSLAAVAVHLRSCAACHEDYQGLVATSHLRWLPAGPHAGVAPPVQGAPRTGSATRHGDGGDRSLPRPQVISGDNRVRSALG